METTTTTTTVEKDNGEWQQKRMMETTKGECDVRWQIEMTITMATSIVNCILLHFHVANLLCNHVVRPLYTQFIVIIEEATAKSAISRPLSWTLLVRCQIPIKKLETSSVALMLASHELQDTCSWQISVQEISPSWWKNMPPLLPWHLNKGSKVPSQTAKPIWEPQHASL